MSVVSAAVSLAGEMAVEILTSCCCRMLLWTVSGLTLWNTLQQTMC